MANPHLDGGQPWWPSTYSSPIPAPNQVSPGHPGGGYQPDLNPPVVTQPLPTPENNNNQVSPGHPGGGYNPNLNPPVVTQPLPLPEANVSTGLGPDDLKIQAKQKRDAEERKKYQDKLIALASSGMSSPGPLMHGLDFSFGGKTDPTLGFIPSGDVPTSDFQKALFLAQHDIGKKTKIYYDDDDNVISPTDAYFSGEEGIAGLGKVVTDPETGKTSFKKTGLGKHILGDVWNYALDPGGLYPDPDNPYGSGDIMSDYFRNARANYFDQNWSGMDNFDYAFYGGGPGETENTLLGGDWRSKGLGEILEEGPKSLSEMEGIYDPEFRDREANWLYLTGIPQFKDITTYS